MLRVNADTYNLSFEGLPHDSLEVDGIFSICLPWHYPAVGDVKGVHNTHDEIASSVLPFHISHELLNEVLVVLWSKE